MSIKKARRVTQRLQDVFLSRGTWSLHVSTNSFIVIQTCRDTKGVDIDAVAGPKDRRRRAKAPGNAAMEMDAIAAANTAVFAMSVAACIAMLVAGMERGRALLALPASHDSCQGCLVHVHHGTDIAHPSKALATDAMTIGVQRQKWPLLRHTHATGVLGGALQGIGLVASSGMAVCILHALLTCLPLCFTIGERSLCPYAMPSGWTQKRFELTAHVNSTVIYIAVSC